MPTGWLEACNARCFPSRPTSRGPVSPCHRVLRDGPVSARARLVSCEAKIHDDDCWRATAPTRPRRQLLNQPPNKAAAHAARVPRFDGWRRWRHIDTRRLRSVTASPARRIVAFCYCKVGCSFVSASVCTSLRFSATRSTCFSRHAAQYVRSHLALLLSGHAAECPRCHAVAGVPARAWSFR